MLVIVALMFDLGRPYRIWHPLVMWNPHSVMFEVAWCVMLYTTVLFLEFLPAVFERLGWQAPLRVLRVDLDSAGDPGVILSTLHQSSLGSLYLIVPHKLHPLWYTPLLPVLFYISAIAAGLAMTIFESWHSEPRVRPATGTAAAGRAGAGAGGGAAGLPGGALHGSVPARRAGMALEPRTESWLFVLEICLHAAARCCCCSAGTCARNPRALYACAVMVIFGFITHRLNVA